jgi:hypothetical protein
MKALEFLKSLFSKKEKHTKITIEDLYKINKSDIVSYEKYQKMMEDFRNKQQSNMSSRPRYQTKLMNDLIKRQQSNVAASYNYGYSSKTTYQMSKKDLEQEIIALLDEPETIQAINQLCTAIRTHNKAMLLLMYKHKDDENFVKKYIAALAEKELSILNSKGDKDE